MRCRDFGTLIVGGDACTADSSPAGRRAAGMINAYGPTESTVVATWSDPLTPGGIPPIGRPICNTKAHVLDDELRPVPVGVAGELYVAGIGLARGYLDRARPHRVAVRGQPVRRRAPACTAPATWCAGRADGALEFLGRADDQVKIRGFRVELGEIEAALAAHPDVRGGGRRARGPARGSSGWSPTSSARDRRPARPPRPRLPAHMVPAAFVPLTELPLTPNGKLDRAALPAPSQESPTAGYVAPETETEEVLAGIWAEALGLERVGVSDNFYDLGGDSVRSLHITSMVRTAFDVELTPRDVLASGTVATLAELIEERVLLELERVAFGDDEV